MNNEEKPPETGEEWLRHSDLTPGSRSRALERLLTGRGPGFKLRDTWWPALVCALATAGIYGVHRLFFR